MQNQRQNFRVKLQIASMDHMGLQSLIKNSTYFRIVHFLSMHYSAASINQEEIQVSF